MIEKRKLIKINKEIYRKAKFRISLKIDSKFNTNRKIIGKMKIASQTVSTQGHTFKNNGFNSFVNDRILPITIKDDYQENLIDFNKFQRQMNKIEQKIICQEIEKYESMNLHKQFPSLLKQLQQKSQKLITFQNKFNTIKQQYTREESQFQKEQEKIEQEKQALEQTLFNLQCDELLKQHYEKQLILGMVDNQEIKMKKMMKDREEKLEEKRILMEQKDQLLDEIENQKQIIMKLAIAKGKIQQQLDYVKNCQIQPIHLIREKSLKSYQAKVKHFENRFNGNESSQGLIGNFCKRYENLIQKQLGQKISTYETSCVNDSIAQQEKILSLQINLNKLTSAKLQKSNQVNIQLLKTKLLSQQIEQKNEEIKKYQQLLAYVQNQSYCVEEIIDCDQIGKRVVNDLELEQKVDNEIHENELLKQKLKQLTEKFIAQKQANIKLINLLGQVKNDHQMRTNKMIAQTNVLKSNLQIKKKIYEDKIEVRQHVIDCQPVKQKPEQQEKSNFHNFQTKIYENYKKQSSLVEQIKRNHQSIKITQPLKIISQRNSFQSMQRTAEPLKLYLQKPQPQILQSKLTELRSRLMKKFQAAENIKK